MDASYLRIKNWGELQHYKDRCPPWIKLYQKVLQDNAFGELTELEQWQLVRIWLVASRSEVTTVDEKGRLVPLLAYSEQSIRRAIGTLKRVPLERFIRDGWLIPMSADEVDLASTVLAPRLHETSALLDTEEQRFRGLDSSSSKALGRLNIDESQMRRLLVATGARTSDDVDKLVRAVVGNRCGEREVAIAIEESTGPGVRDALAVGLSSLKKNSRSAAA